jgi:Abi-like protein
MQEKFCYEIDAVSQLRDSLSKPRFNTYVKATNGNEIAAIELYEWNMRISQSMYIYLQTWEIVLRNKLNEFLCWKFNADWPYDERRAVRNLAGREKKKLFDAIERQQRERSIDKPSTPMIVADLSAGFWVSLLSAHYVIPFSWRYNMGRIFPNDKYFNTDSAWPSCNELLILRNRIAHHEPVFYMPLEALYWELNKAVSGMCAASSAFAGRLCPFTEIMDARPQINP